MKSKLLLIVGILLMISVVSAYQLQTIYSPFSGKLDYIVTSNFSGDNLTADFFFGDGSQLTGISTFNLTYDNLNSSQWIVSGNNISNRNSGNVGIGTSTPQRSLQVYSDNPTIGQKRTADDLGWSWYVGSDGSFNMREYTSTDWTAGRDVFNIVKGGNVDIASPSSGVVLTLGRVSGQPSIKSSATFLIMESSGGELRLNNYISDDVILANGGGNVGIGTVSPADALTVTGDINVSGCIEEDDGTLIGGTCVSGREYKTNETLMLLNWSKFNSVSPKVWKWKKNKIIINKTRLEIIQIIDKDNNTINETRLIKYNETIYLSNTRGFIYEDIEKVYPERIRIIDGIKRVSYGFDWVLENRLAIKNLRKTIRIMRNEIISLKAENQIIKLAFCKEHPANSLCG